jgi:hypothetical protein
VAELAEVTRIDGNEHALSVIVGSSQKHAPRSVAVAADGTIAINQYQERLVRLFDRAGQAIGTAGRWGEGPGEFDVPGPITWLADTLWVFDQRLLRATAFSRSGEYIRSFRYPNQTEPGPVGGELTPRIYAPLIMPMDVSSNPVNSVLAWGAPIGDQPSERFEDASFVFQLTPSGVIARVIAVLRTDEAEYEYRTGRFRNSWVYDVSRRAGRAAQARGAPLKGPDAGTFDVTAVDLEGDTVFTRRLPFELVRITDQARDSAMGRISNPLIARHVRSQPTPPYYPPLNDLVVGDDASVWLEMWPRADGQPYVVLDSLGTEVGTALLPPGSRVAVARLDRIWAVEKDVLDVESVVEYQVAWR